jgi:hypothetical protein
MQAFERDAESVAFTYMQAGANGHLHVLQYMDAAHLPRDLKNVSEAAAKRGIKDVLEYLYALPLRAVEHEHPVDLGRVACLAAMFGRAETLQWAIDHGGSWENGYDASSPFPVKDKQSWIADIVEGACVCSGDHEPSDHVAVAQLLM